MKCCIRIHNTDRYNTVILGLLGKGSLDTLIKKENQIFLMCKEIQNGAVAKSYMRKAFLIYEKMRKYFPIYEEAVSHI
jgi:putative heme iron utilization protein